MYVTPEAQFLVQNIWDGRATAPTELATLTFGLTATTQRDVHIISIPGATPEVFRGAHELNDLAQLNDLICEEMDIMVDDDSLVVVVPTEALGQDRHTQMALAAHIVGLALLYEGQPEHAATICVGMHAYDDLLLSSPIKKAQERRRLH